MSAEFRITQSKDAMIKYEIIKEKLNKFNKNIKNGNRSLEENNRLWTNLRQLVAEYVNEVTDFTLIKETIESVEFNDRNGITVKFLDLKNDSLVELSINQQSLADLDSKSDLIQ
ncbi:MAG: hypothetical protein Q4P29_07925 [Tissierellia bacterium]|nr:hypothetical protein [Tissierellia bacterium]